MKLKVALLGVAGFVAAACGDDGGATPDARMIDARPDVAPDADEGVNFFSDEGGEVRFEYVRKLDGTAFTRVISFFEANDDVDNHMYPTIPGCTILTDDTKWPTSQPMNRDYVDAGTLTVTNGTETLVVPKATAAKDPLQRDHGIGNWYFHAGTTDGDTYVKEKKSYDVVFGGSAEWPAQTFEDALYIPADFDLISPAVGVTPALTAATDFTATWEVVASANPTTVPNAWSVVGFINGTDGAVALCIEPQNDGSITVPAAMVDMIRTASPGGGTMIRQTFHHQVRELTNGTTVKNRRIDMIGVWCYAYPYTVP